MKHNLGFISIVNDAKSRVQEISADDVQQKIASHHQFYLIDVREEHEFANSHLPNAKHLCKGVLECYIETEIPDQSAEIVLYCGGGYRSALAADNLQKMGYSNVYSMAAGFRGWKEQQLPLAD